jgi:negative regulator of sigma E activity
MSLANITHTQNKGLVTLSWTPVAGASNIELSIQKPGQKTFNTLESVLMSDGLYEFTVPAGGTYIVKFTPIDASGQPS